jgi:exo-1,4-beta-D-glucosaminidase
MITQTKHGLLVLIFLIMGIIVNTGCTKEIQPDVIPLDKEWQLQPHGHWGDDGERIDSVGYVDENSIHCNVPNTVLGALVESGKYPDLFFSDNLKRVPVEWFQSHWRYVKTFDLDRNISNRYARLCFDGINYSADIFLNGEKIGAADTIKGAFRRFALDVTEILKQRGNRLEVRVFPPEPGDFTVGFVDWTPRPPDRNMGLFRGVSLRFYGPVSIEQPFVKSHINPDNLREAELTIESRIVNHSDKEMTAVVQAVIEEITLEQKVELQPLEEKILVWTPERFSALKLTDARLWWPHTMGNPELYRLQMECKVNSEVSDNIFQKFGIREVSDYINENGSRMYTINGRDIQIRSGGWTDDLLLREKAENVKAQVLYTKLMNLNCIRLEGVWGASQTLYDLCDKHGILLMVGWSCQWEWDGYLGKECDQFGGIKTPEDMKLVNHYLEDQVLWLRHHPSIFVWVMGSDMLPRPALEKMYLKNLEVNDPTRPVLMACSTCDSEVTGPTGVKMNGPYDYVSPNYWYLDTQHGGAWGFNTETGPGPQIPPLESLQKMFPEDKLWPVNEIWDYHSGRNQFNTIENYHQALNERYGPSENIEEFVQKAQLANYEAIRAMFEAFAVNKAKAGGIVQWMLNAAWPKLYWQLYDYYLMPNGAFFGTQSALKSLNIIYNYGDQDIYVSNDHYEPFDNLVARIRYLDGNSKVIFEKEVPFSIDSYTSRKIIEMPVFDDLTPVYFADLRIRSAEGTELSNNFYWLSVKKDIPDFENSRWYVTPLKQFADFTGLSTMPKADIESDFVVEKQGNQTVCKVSLKNISEKLAFFIELKVKGRESNELILPAFWSENYVCILPGEEKELTVRINNADLKDEEPVLEINGMNLERK